IFVGNFDHGPNSSSAIFLKHEVAPLAIERTGPMPFYIVGNNPPYLIRNMQKFGPAAEHFKITGYVPDTRKYLDRAKVSVAPILFGAGMNGKIGEALAAGLPVVTTALGASGMGLTHEENCLVAETAEEFADAIHRLHTDEVLWNRLSTNGRAYLKQSLGFEQIATTFHEQFASCLPLKSEKASKARVKGKSKDIALKLAHFPPVKHPEISVVVLCYNQWPYTERCLRSLSNAQAANSGLKVEYILVDNCSTDNTVAEARKIKGLKVIANPTNSGFAAGNNVGMRAARGKNIVLLNNDTIVPPDWLKRMHEQAQRISHLGILGPSTNTEPGQALFGARYNNLREFFDYNKEIGRKNLHQWELCEKISGLCMYVPRAVIDKVGYLSEDYGMGYFEDDDYCFRVRDAGFRTVWAKDTYVHHFGSVSFELSSKSREKHLHYGMSQFIFKWGKRALNHISHSHRKTLIKPVEQLHL
ncbi:MAG TPA: glycosyltransferase, partial [Bdellovibrionota bacterium]